MPESINPLLLKAIDRLEVTVNALTGIANSMSHEMQSTNFRIKKTEEMIRELQTDENSTLARVDKLDRILVVNEGKFDAVIKDLQELKETIKDIKTSLKSEYVTKEQFSPIQKVIYAITGLALTAIVGALLNIVIIKP